MSNNRFEFSRSLIGYKRRQVNKYMHKLIMKNNMEANEIKESISIFLEKNEILQKKLEELKYQMEFGDKQQESNEFVSSESKSETAVTSEPGVCESVENENSQESKEIHGQSEYDVMPENKNDLRKTDEEIEINNTDAEILESKAPDKVVESKTEILFEDSNKPTYKASSFWEYEFEELFTETAVDCEEEPGSKLGPFENQKKGKNEEKQEEVPLLKENIGGNDININEEENNKLENEGLENRIKDIGSKYLINKIVGEDLMDRKGNLLAKKGSLITENLIQAAGREGKLAELIVNMILPDTSE